MTARVAWELARRPKVCKLAAVPRLRTLVAEQLQQDWSTSSPSVALTLGDHANGTSGEGPDVVQQRPARQAHKLRQPVLAGPAVTSR